MRPSSVRTPISTLLCAGTEPPAEKADAVSAYLRKPLNSGHEVMAAMAILRAMYQSAYRKGLAGLTVPFISRANNHYVSHMLALTGRIYVSLGSHKPRPQGVGLTAYGAPSPVDASWMQPGTISSHLYRPNSSCSVVARDLAFGNPYGVGITGSANIFLYAADYFNTRGNAHIDLVDMATSMAVMLCYNGGHSFNEVYRAAQINPGAAHGTPATLRSYHPGQARSLFIDQVDPQDRWLAEDSFGRLAIFLMTLSEAIKTGNT